MDDRLNTPGNSMGTTGRPDSTMGQSTTGQVDNRTALGSTGSMNNATSGQLAHLSEMDDYEIADGEPDIVGWDVCASNGEKIGDVEDLLVDSATMRVRYLEVKLETDLVPNNDRRHCLIPIGSARLDDDQDNVLVSMESERLLALPPYVRGALSRGYEQSVVDGFARPGGRVVSTNDDSERDFYDDDDNFNDRRMFETRRELGRRDDAYLRRRSE